MNLQTLKKEFEQLFCEETIIYVNTKKVIFKHTVTHKQIWAWIEQKLKAKV